MRRAYLGGEGMMLPIASPVEPQDRPGRAGRRQRVQHRQHRRRADPRAEQHHGALSGLQNEASARRADVERIAHPHVVAQVRSSGPVRLDLYADAIALGREGARERVAAKEWRTAGGRLKTQDHVLARQRRRQRLTVRALQRQREDVRGLVIDRRHRERPKSGRGRMRGCRRREPRVPTAPVTGLCSNASNDERHPGESASIRKRALQPVGRMIGRIQQRVDLGDGHPLLRLSHLHDVVAGAHLAFPEDAEVEPRPSAGRQQRRHPRLVHPDADAIAGHARLGDLEQRAADLIPVADAHHIVGQSFDREVLAELSVDEVGPLQLLLPVAIRFDLVDEDGALLTSVPGQVALTVSVQIQPADPAAAGTGSFQIPVCTVRPFHSMSRGSPTFTDSSRAMSPLQQSTFAVCPTTICRFSGPAGNEFRSQSAEAVQGQVEADA